MLKGQRELFVLSVIFKLIVKSHSALWEMYNDNGFLQD